MNYLLISVMAVMPFLLGALCSVNIQTYQPNEIELRATSFAEGEYPDLVISDLSLVTPYSTAPLTPTPTYTGTALAEQLTVTPFFTGTAVADSPASPAEKDEKKRRATEEIEDDIQTASEVGETPVGPPEDRNPLTPEAEITGTPARTAAPVVPTLAPTGSTPVPVEVTPTPAEGVSPDVPTATSPPSDNPKDPTSVPNEQPTTVPDNGTATPDSGNPPTSTPNANLPNLAFSQETYQTDEGAGQTVITVNLDQTSADTIFVDYLTSPGTASQNFDYTPSQGQFMFNPGETSKTFNIPIIDDNTDDPDVETVNLSLSNPVSVNIIRDQALLQIIDNDQQPTIQFSQADYSVAENQISLLTVTLSHPSGHFISVAYDIFNNPTSTAFSGQDYQAFTFGSVGFGPDSSGETPLEVTFAWSELVDDSVLESNETLKFKLVDPPLNANLGVYSSTMLTIVDNDN
ncbi:Calx-beta domain-containing protein [Anaerolineales bacterium HSG6]|nr:Calx-beta domain-containing protein [Anaerolineales bacterium HSG6]